MDGENNGKPYEQIDDLGVTTHIFGNTYFCSTLLQHSLSTKRCYNSEASNLQHKKKKLLATSHPSWQHTCPALTAPMAAFMQGVSHLKWSVPCSKEQGEWISSFQLGISKNSGVSPQIIHFNKVFHYFHHPFWGITSPYFRVDMFCCTGISLGPKASTYLCHGRSVVATLGMGMVIPPLMTESL